MSHTSNSLDLIPENIEEAEFIYPLFQSHRSTWYTFNMTQDDCSTQSRQIHTWTRKHGAESTLKRSQDESSLFVDDIWPASFLLADYIVQNSSRYIKDRYVLELGAGAALPSLVADCLGATKVVITDYHADGVIETINEVIKSNSLNHSVAVGYIWGEKLDVLASLGLNGGFHTILMADLFWKDTYHLHRKLLATVKSILLSHHDAVALVAFAHRETATHLSHHDMEFFDVAVAEFQLSYEFILKTSDYGCDVDTATPTTLFLYEIKHRL